MVAGLNLKIRVWRMGNLDDDEVAGARISGTVSYESVYARFEQPAPNFLLLQQGLEVTDTIQCTCRPPNLNIKERDEVEVIFPLNHPLYGKKLRITSIQLSDLHPSDSRGKLILFLTRSDYAHANQ